MSVVKVQKSAAILGFATLVLVGCETVDTVTKQVTKAVTVASKDETPSCDPAFSLAGFFDSRPEVLIEKPANHPAAGDLRRIAVIPPSGDGSDEFTRRFESALVSIKNGDQPYFQVVTRTDLDKVMATQGFDNSGAVAAGSAAQLGRVLGVDGIYIPQILEYNISDSTFTKKGDRPVRCQKRTASFRSIPKLVDVSTGQVVYAEEHGNSQEQIYCPGGSGSGGGLATLTSLTGGGGLKEGSSMMGEILDQAMTAFVTDVAPRSCLKKMNVMDDTDGLSNESTLEKFEAAVAFMKTGRHDRACPAWQSLEASGEKAISLYNNLAICSEINDELVVARDYCAKADAMLTWPSEDINQCIETVEKRLVETAADRTTGCSALVSRESVRELQQLLVDYGYLDRSAADGILGPSTLGAVLNFQTEKGLPSEGRVDSCLLDDLRSL